MIFHHAHSSQEQQLLSMFILERYKPRTLKCRVNFFVQLEDILAFSSSEMRQFSNSAGLWSTWTAEAFHNPTSLTLCSEQNSDVQTQI